MFVWNVLLIICQDHIFPIAQISHKWKHIARATNSDHNTDHLECLTPEKREPFKWSFCGMCDCGWIDEIETSCLAIRFWFVLLFLPRHCYSLCLTFNRSFLNAHFLFQKKCPNLINRRFWQFNVKQCCRRYACT